MKLRTINFKAIIMQTINLTGEIIHLRKRQEIKYCKYSSMERFGHARNKYEFKKVKTLPINHIKTRKEYKPRIQIEKWKYNFMA